jgi:hypothetical protein
MMAGVDMIHVPYRSEALALPDLISGQVQMMFGVMPASLGYIRAGKLRALAVTSAKRQEILPDAPALNEFFPGYEANGWYGIGAPKATPTEIIEKLNKEINAALFDPTIKGRLTDLGCNVFAGSPADFGKFIADETEKWAKLIWLTSRNPKAPAVKPRGRGGCPGGGGLEGRGRSRAGGLRSADRRGGTGRGGLAGALPPTIGPVQGPEADRRGRSVPDRRPSERPQSAEDTPARDGLSAIAGAARTTSRVCIRCTGPGKDLRRRGEKSACSRTCRACPGG